MRSLVNCVRDTISFIWFNSSHAHMHRILLIHIIHTWHHCNHRIQMIHTWHHCNHRIQMIHIYFVPTWHRRHFFVAGSQWLRVCHNEQRSSPLPSQTPSHGEFHMESSHITSTQSPNSWFPNFNAQFMIPQFVTFVRIYRLRHNSQFTCFRLECSCPQHSAQIYRLRPTRSTCSNAGCVPQCPELRLEFLTPI